jgi:hypothetical protein
LGTKTDLLHSSLVLEAECLLPPSNRLESDRLTLLLLILERFVT